MEKSKPTASSDMSSSSKQGKDNCVGTPSDIDPYGFVRKDDFDYKSYEQFESDYLAVLSRRTMRWGKKMKKDKFKHDRTTKRFCRKGIPQQFRSKVWMDISGAQVKLESNPGLYHKHLTTPNEDQRAEAVLQEDVTTDLNRTFPDNIYFMDGSREDRKSCLRNVLIAYGRFNHEVAYCQGMNYLLAILLLVVKDEEKCFWLLSSLIDDILPDYYSHGMLALRADLAVLEDLVSLKYPLVDQKMKELHATWMIIASKWFICVFIDVLPIETVVRIWDCLFFEGSKVLFRAALTLIHEKMPKVLQCRSMSDLAAVFRVSENEPTTLDCHGFMQKCFSVPNPLSKKKINDLRVKSRTLFAKEDEEIAKKKRNET